VVNTGVNHLVVDKELAATTDNHLLQTGQRDEKISKNIPAALLFICGILELTVKLQA